MRRWAAASGSLAVMCFLPACSSSAAGTSPPSPAPFASRADQVVADLAAGNFTAVEGKVDPAMVKATRTLPCRRHGLPASICWARIEATVRRRLPERANSTLSKQVPRHDGPWAGRSHHRLQPQRDHCGAALRTVTAVAKGEGGAAPSNGADGNGRSTHQMHLHCTTLQMKGQFAIAIPVRSIMGTWEVHPGSLPSLRAIILPGRMVRRLACGDSRSQASCGCREPHPCHASR